MANIRAAADWLPPVRLSVASIKMRSISLSVMPPLRGMRMFTNADSGWLFECPKMAPDRGRAMSGYDYDTISKICQMGQKMVF